MYIVDVYLLDLLKVVIRFGAVCPDYTCVFTLRK